MIKFVCEYRSSFYFFCIFIFTLFVLVCVCILLSCVLVQMLYIFVFAIYIYLIYFQVICHMLFISSIDKGGLDVLHFVCSAHSNIRPIKKERNNRKTFFKCIFHLFLNVYIYNNMMCFGVFLCRNLRGVVLGFWCVFLHIYNTVRAR